MVTSRYFLSENSALPVKWLLSSMLLRRWASTVSRVYEQFFVFKKAKTERFENKFMI